jgi:hypothetical protein
MKTRRERSNEGCATVRYGKELLARPSRGHEAGACFERRNRAGNGGLEILLNAECDFGVKNTAQRLPRDTKAVYVFMSQLESSRPAGDSCDLCLALRRIQVCG